MNKDKPIIIVKSFSEFYEQAKLFLREGIIERVNVEGKDPYFYFKDKDPKSDFYFKLKNFRLTNTDKPIFIIDYKPWHIDSLTPQTGDFYLDGLIDSLKEWVSLIKKYNESEDFSINESFSEKDDNRLQEEINAIFDGVDENTKDEIFDFNSQVNFSNQLDEIIKVLESHIGQLNSEEIEEKVKVEEIVKEVKWLQKFLPKLTKEEVIDKAKEIVIKSWKVSVKMAGEVVVKLIVEGTFRLIRGDFHLPI